MSRDVLGIGSVVGAMLVLSLQDALVKQFHADYALHQIMAVRALVALLLSLAVVHFLGGLRQLATRNFPLLFLRGGLLVIANSCFFLGLAAMPFAENVALFFIAPLLITALSALHLGEPVGPRRWLGVGLGLVGVIVMLRPGADLFRWTALFPLFAALVYAYMQLLTRHLAHRETTGTMTTYMQVTLLTVSASIGAIAGNGDFSGSGNISLAFLWREWTWPTNADLAIWCGLGILNAIGAYLMTQGYRVANASAVAPFEYVAMPFAVLWGYTLYAEIPDLTAAAGIALIIGGGLYVVHREIVRSRLRET